MEVYTLLFSSDILKNKLYYLPLLLIISIISHFPFVLKGFGEPDAARIGVSVIDSINNGTNGTLANFYFTDVIPLYIVYLKYFIGLFEYNYYYLPIIMNYTDAVFGTLTIIPAFFLIKKLFDNATVAFFSVLILIFAPAFYHSNIYGFPHLLAFFFFLSSLCFYVLWLDKNRKTLKYFWIIMSCFALTVTILFKSDYVLAIGAYFGILYIKKVKEKANIVYTLLTITMSVAFFISIRYWILGTTGGTTNSFIGFSKWFNYFFAGLTSLFSLSFLNYQIKPIVASTGIFTFFLGIIAFVFYLLRKKLDILIFVISWTFLPTLVWLLLHGNSARHNMLSILPFIVMIIMFCHEKAPRYSIHLTGLLILGNFLITVPSISFFTPSGNLFKGQKLLQARVNQLHSEAKEIIKLEDNKIVVLGYFHNSYVLYEIISSSPSYKAMRIGRENYKIIANEKEYMLFYTPIGTLEELKAMTNYILTEYKADDYIFVSATYDLQFLENYGIKTKKFRIIKYLL
jgi:hypothetical protein